MISINELPSFFLNMKEYNEDMKPITENTIKLLSKSGFILIFFSITGSLAMASMRVEGSLKGQTWNDMFMMLFTAVLGIAIYYLALSLFSWSLAKKKKRKAQAVA